MCVPQAFVEHTRRNHKRRDARMAEMVARLARQGVTVTRTRLDEQRGAAEVAYSRPHLARALVKAGYAEHRQGRVRPADRQRLSQPTCRL